MCNKCNSSGRCLCEEFRQAGRDEQGGMVLVTVLILVVTGGAISILRWLLL